MALTFRSFISKCGSKISFGVISFEKNLGIRFDRHKVVGSQTSMHLKSLVSIRNYTMSSQYISSQSKSDVNNADCEHFEKIVFHNYHVDVIASKPHNMEKSSKLSTNHIRLVSQPKPHIKQEPANATDYTEKQNDSNHSHAGRPSPDKLKKVLNGLADDLPNLFVTSLDYRMYHPEMVFENNILDRRSVGITPYIRQMTLLRTIGHLRFAYVKLNILKITQHPEDSTIRVRWTIKGISGLKIIFLFWKYRLWHLKELFEKTVPWYDGFSTFHVNGEGKIYKHVVDRMMPDMDREEIKARRTSPIDAAKLTLIVGIIPKFSDLNSFF